MPAQLRDRLDVAHRNSIRLLKLVNSLLGFSRIEAGRARASFEAVDLAALTSELAANFRSACERAGLELVINCPPLPESAFVDRDMWEKIVLNPLSNAFKFTFEGRIEVAVRVTSGSPTLSIRDTGVGIPEGELPRIFERFHRIEGQRSRTYEGSGIGLALVRELVKLRQGNIRVDSSPGVGTIFTVTVPFRRAQPTHDLSGAERSLAPTSVRTEAFVDEAERWSPYSQAQELGDGDIERRRRPQRSTGAPTILVADDNADMREYLKRLLTPHYEVQTTEDGAAALSKLRRRRPDLLLCDVMMPQLDGFGLLRAIRTDPELQDLPVILLSARAGEESRVDGVNSGADDYLVKPFSARELLARVSVNIRLARLRSEAVEAVRANERQLRDMNATLQQRATEALAEKRFLAELVEATDTSVQVVDSDFRFAAINEAAQRDFVRVFGVRPSVGDSILDVLAQLPDQQDAACKVWRRALAGEAFTETGWWGGEARTPRL
jgi:DNA-binding response OmpR family regulator